MLPKRLSLSLLLTAGMAGAMAMPCRGQTQTLEQALASLTVATRTAPPQAPVPLHPGELVANLQQQGLSVLVLERTNRRLQATGDPIWDLRIEIPGQPIQHFEALSGRANRQSANRDQMGSRAPLPSGHYKLGPVEPLAAGAYPELGPIWIGIEPTFRTGRRVLGIHQDPSAGRNANSGTLGCIGLIRRNDLLELASQVRKANIQELVVTN